ncbi:5-carboxymethyl-2-hydroxymuconate isomerase [Shimia litoralis]|uniref:5-carboxymethyl-2-hydroxymuconate isomerase n=1 Tax=Shimia litoralis TaxID=420403 RepID=A0A4U7MWK1_9RHOB|nr:5-carboxymethyl-2-hydroxymuconate isomerase [Shimia litoralis]TKZ17398.1 5-carboxymethyl-2-hydroxymuconate isomerase [Shimia litoralis]
MPHLVLEHSPDLTHSHDLNAVSKALFKAACESPVFIANPDAVKVRTICCENHQSATTPNTFAHLTVRLLSGREPEAKAQLAQSLLDIMDAHLPDVGSLSVEPVDMDRATYRKRTL